MGVVNSIPSKNYIHRLAIRLPALPAKIPVATPPIPGRGYTLAKSRASAGHPHAQGQDLLGKESSSCKYMF
jgi:hypothetical protein